MNNLPYLIHMLLAILLALVPQLLAAQPAKGRLVLSGSIYADSYASNRETPQESNNLSFSTNVGVGRFVTDRLLLTPTVGFRYYESKSGTSGGTPYRFEQFERTYSVGVGAQYFLPAKTDKLYITLSASAQYEVSVNSRGSTLYFDPYFQSYNIVASHETGVSGNASTGLAYVLNPKWMLQTNLLNLTASYSNERTNGVSSISNGVRLSGLINNFGLSAFYFLR